jgi:hypothetical protein
MLHQRLSDVTGSFELQGPTNLIGYVTADLWGAHLRCWCVPTNTLWHPNQVWLDGQIDGDNFTGALRRFRSTNTIETEWAARRDPVDFTGTWEWPGATNAPVRLKIERREGRLTLTYTDKNRQKTPWRDDTRPIDVFDTYDFGGGFYFTLLLGLEGKSFREGPRRLGPDDGWLVGEAVMEDGKLKGSLGLYPYSHRGMLDSPGPEIFPPREAKGVSPPARRDWKPKRVGD